MATTRPVDSKFGVWTLNVSEHPALEQGMSYGYGFVAIMT